MHWMGWAIVIAFGLALLFFVLTLMQGDKSGEAAMDGAFLTLLAIVCAVVGAVLLIIKVAFL